jgi:hypothetical protein
MSKMQIIGIFDDEDILLSGVKSIQDKGVKIKDVFSPYPIHGLDKALGLKDTRISICAFLYGITGTCLALLMMWYMMIHDWPMDIGGKPNATLLKNLPAFIPITFEITVLCCAHGMVITFYLRSKILPGVIPNVLDERMSDDKMVMQLEAKDATEAANMMAMLREAGATEVK